MAEPDEGAAIPAFATRLWNQDIDQIAKMRERFRRVFATVSTDTCAARFSTAERRHGYRRTDR
jgi:hypothetical protein